MAIKAAIQGGKTLITTSRAAARALPKVLQYVPKLTPEQAKMSRHMTTQLLLNMVPGMTGAWTFPGGTGWVDDVASGIHIGPDSMRHAITREALEESGGMYRSVDAKEVIVENLVDSEADAMILAQNMDEDLSKKLYARGVELEDNIESIDQQLESGIPYFDETVPDPTDEEILTRLDELQRTKTVLDEEYKQIQDDIRSLKKEGERREARTLALLDLSLIHI